MKLATVRSSVQTQVDKLLFRPTYLLNHYFLYSSRLAFATSRGALNAATRNLDPANTLSWEFSAFSQNGEDGIIDHLATLISKPNRYFIEIGASEGLENNSSYLALVKKYNGIMIEGNSFKSRFARILLQAHCSGVEFQDTYITPQTAPQLVESSWYRDPDFFSLDIDGLDYYIAKCLFERGLRPKIICVEYNSAFGPAQSVTIPYQPFFDVTKAHPTRLYYGVSLTAWQNFFMNQGYEFVTVDFNGVNAFFVDPEMVDTSTFQGINRLDWRENCSQRARFHSGWNRQFDLIKDMPFEVVE